MIDDCLNLTLHVKSDVADMAGLCDWSIMEYVCLKPVYYSHDKTL